MTAILALDPGPTRTGVVSYANGRVLFAEPEMLNGAVLAHLQHGDHPPGQVLAIEIAESFGQKVWSQVFDAVRWAGRFQQAWHDPDAVRLVTRAQVKLELLGKRAGNDQQLRQALIQRVGLPGTKKAPGPTYGVTSHAWAALAVAVTAWHELQQAQVLDAPEATMRIRDVAVAA